MLFAMLVSAIIATPSPVFRARIDFGIPDSLCVSLRVDRIAFVEAGLITDFGGVGFKGAMGVVLPSLWFLVPELRAEAGYVYRGDVTPVARFVTGNGALDFDVLKKVDYSFVSLAVGLAWQPGRFEIFGRVGWSWLKSARTDLGSDIRAAVGEDVSSKRAGFDYAGLSIRAGVGVSW